MKTNFDSKEQRYEAGRYLAKVLRMLAPSLGLEVDNHGWIKLGDVLKIMNAVYPFIRLEHIEEIVNKDAQKRFAILPDRIRAKSGHKFVISVPSEPITPPEYLYHGTNPESATAILVDGLRKMGKAYVHLASTTERANRIGMRKCKKPAIIKIHAGRASANGIRFWKSGQISSDGEIYLSEEIPPDFIEYNNK